MELLHKGSEVRQLSDKELEARVRAAKARLRELRFKNVTEKLENTAETGQIRRMVARLQTVQTERRAQAGKTAKTK